MSKDLIIQSTAIVADDYNQLIDNNLLYGPQQKRRRLML